jgi:TPR repeat protein
MRRIFLCAFVLLACPFTALAQNSASALDTQAQSFYAQKNYAAAFAAYQAAAQQGDAAGENWTGYMYSAGLGVTKDPAAAVVWFQMSAAQGLADGEFNLGGMYFNGTGVTQDYAQAMSWYSKAAVQNFAAAHEKLGEMYYDGHGTATNFQLALGNFAPAAAAGLPESENFMGLMYQRAQGGLQTDYTQALAWYAKAAAQNNADAEDNIGYCYLNGLGVPVNLDQARAWFQKAAAQGETAAIAHLAAMDAATQPAPASGGSCAVVYAAFTQNPTYGETEMFGASYGQSALATAESGASAQLNGTLNGAQVLNVAGVGPGNGILAIASGCGFSHGAVAVIQKFNPAATGGAYVPIGDNIYSTVQAALANDAADANANAINNCKNAMNGTYIDAYNCHVVFQW